MATGMQNIDLSLKENKDYIAGIQAGWDALREIYDMPTEDRYYLFEGAGLPKLVHEWEPKTVLSILANKDHLLQQRVNVGDVIEREGIELIITYVYEDKLHFDAIITSGPLRGSVWKHTTLEISCASKTGRTAEEYEVCYKAHYDWE